MNNHSHSFIYFALVTFQRARSRPFFSFIGQRRRNGEGTKITAFLPPNGYLILYSVNSSYFSRPRKPEQLADLLVGSVNGKLNNSSRTISSSFPSQAGAISELSKDIFASDQVSLFALLKEKKEFTFATQPLRWW